MAEYVDALLEQTAHNSAFNAEQAQINRDWQTYMSGTSHQREVADLIAAGLNPVLSANSGSSWQSVSNATADVSSAQGLANLAATYLNNQASIEMSKISAAATTAAAGATAAATIAAAERSARATEYAAGMTPQGQIAKVMQDSGLTSELAGAVNSGISAAKSGDLSWLKIFL